MKRGRENFKFLIFVIVIQQMSRNLKSGLLILLSNLCLKSLLVSFLCLKIWYKIFK